MGTIFLRVDRFATAGIGYGDGLRCVDGKLVRLGTKQHSWDSAQFSEPGDASIAVRGGTPPGRGTLACNLTVPRNALSFCMPATFDITDGIRVAWSTRCPETSRPDLRHEARTPMVAVLMRALSLRAHFVLLPCAQA